MKEKNISKIASIIKKDIEKLARRWKWKSISSAIEMRQLSQNEAEVYVNENVHQIAKYLHYGTKRHWIQPKKAKALHWMQGGKHRFSKGHFVSGIISYKFFSISKEARYQIEQYISSLKNLWK